MPGQGLITQRAVVRSSQTKKEKEGEGYIKESIIEMENSSTKPRQLRKVRKEEVLVVSSTHPFLLCSRGSLNVRKFDERTAWNVSQWDV